MSLLRDAYEMSKVVTLAPSSHNPGPPAWEEHCPCDSGESNTSWTGSMSLQP